MRCVNSSCNCSKNIPAQVISDQPLQQPRIKTRMSHYNDFYSKSSHTHSWFMMNVPSQIDRHLVNHNQLLIVDLKAEIIR